MGSPFEEAAEALLYSEELHFKTRGRSMEPLFKEKRDIIVIRQIDREPKRGDVVLYPDTHGVILVLHRVLRVKGDKVIIRGDNNFFTETRYKDEIIGIMTSFFREGKYCDITKSKSYKIYTFWILNSYYIRAAWRKTRFFLGTIKQKIIRKKPVD